MASKLRVGILFGGRSGEHEVPQLFPGLTPGASLCRPLRGLHQTCFLGRLGAIEPSSYPVPTTRNALLALFDLFDDAVGVGVAGAESAREPVATAGGDRFAVDEHIELAGFAGRANRIDAETTLNQGRETRDLRGIVVSGGTMNDFDLQL
ncbi:MAG: hypothetical protein JO041_09660 [Acidobacteria bacterium]|nr:hypothetical protein [Acidobacteriota bacterium]